MLTPPSLRIMIAQLDELLQTNAATLHAAVKSEQREMFEINKKAPTDSLPVTVAFFFYAASLPCGLPCCDHLTRERELPELCD